MKREEALELLNELQSGITFRQIGEDWPYAKQRLGIDSTWVYVAGAWDVRTKILMVDLLGFDWMGALWLEGYVTVSGDRLSWEELQLRADRGIARRRGRRI